MTLIEVLTIQADHAQQSHAEVDVACKMIQRSETKYSHSKLGVESSDAQHRFRVHAPIIQMSKAVLLTTTCSGSPTYK